MSEGELLQVEKARRLDISEEIYYQIIRQKTASLITAACTCGAKSIDSVSAEQLQYMNSYGEFIGMAFQIKDDLMDLSPDWTGKPKIHDIKEKKMTLPLIKALAQAPGRLKRDIIDKIRKHSEDKNVVREVVKFIFDYDGVDQAEKVMIDYRDKALKILEVLPQNDINETLRKLSFFVTERKK